MSKCSEDGMAWWSKVRQQESRANLHDDYWYSANQYSRRTVSFKQSSHSWSQVYTPLVPPFKGKKQRKSKILQDAEKTQYLIYAHSWQKWNINGILFKKKVCTSSLSYVILHSCWNVPSERVSSVKKRSKFTYL